MPVRVTPAAPFSNTMSQAKNKPCYTHSCVKCALGEKWVTFSPLVIIQYSTLFDPRKVNELHEG